MGWTFYNASGQQLRATADKTATQAEMEAGSALTSFVTPGRTQFHPAVAKFWAKFDGSGTAALDVDYNVTSLTDNGTGDYTITIATDFSTIEWAFALTASTTSIRADAGAPTVTAIRFATINDAHANADASMVCIIGWGDQ